MESRLRDALGTLGWVRLAFLSVWEALWDIPGLEAISMFMNMRIKQEARVSGLSIYGMQYLAAFEA